MKKLIAITLTLLLVLLALFACNSGKTTNDGQGAGSSEQTTAPTTVTLTTENVNDYLSITGVYSKITRSTVMGYAGGDSDISLSIDPTVPGSFYNTVITVEVTLTYGWDVASSDPAYSDDDGKLTTTIRLPANGSKSETHHLVGFMSFGEHNNQDVKIKVTAIEGTFKPEN